MTRYRLAILVVPALTLAACAERQQAPVLAAPIGRSVPDELLTCAPKPASGSVRTDVDAARYVTDLASAGRDCRTKLGATGAILRGER